MGFAAATEVAPVTQYVVVQISEGARLKVNGREASLKAGSFRLYGCVYRSGCGTEWRLLRLTDFRSTGSSTIELEMFKGEERIAFESLNIQSVNTLVKEVDLTRGLPKGEVGQGAGTQ